MSESDRAPAINGSADRPSRRDAMLDHLLCEMDGLHRRRRSRRRVIAATAPVCAFAIAAVIMLRPSRPAAVESIAHGPRVVAPLATSPVVRVTKLTDQQLLDELASMNRPTGLVRSGSKAWLTREVTDEAFHQRESS